jgi:hypothetical protein
MNALQTALARSEAPIAETVLEVREKFGTPGGNRTPDPRLRRPMLYPTELRARGSIIAT